MISETELPLDVIKKNFASPFYDKLADDIHRQQELLNQTEEIYQLYCEKLSRLDGSKDKPRYINETQWLKSTLFDTLEKQFPEKREIYFEEEFKDFFEKCMVYLERLPKEITAEQSLERFHIQADDSFFIKLAKPLKSFLFSISTIPKRTANLFRTEKKQIKYWSHKIPLRYLARHYFLNKFIAECLPIFKEVQKLKCEALHIKWSIDKDINIELDQFISQDKQSSKELLEHLQTLAEKNRINEQKDSLERKLQEWEAHINQVIERLFEEYNQAVNKVDTIELSKNTFSESIILNDQKQFKNEHLRLTNGWRNTLFAQLDDFQLDIEFYQIKYGGLLQFSLLENSFKNRINNTIGENIKLIKKELDSVTKKLSSKEKSNKEIQKTLIQEKKRLMRALEREILPQAIEAIYDQNLPNLLDRLEQKIKDRIDKMKVRRIIYSQNNYDSPISKNDLSHFNPKELVLIDAFQKFSELNKKLKSQVVKQIEDIQNELRSLSGIVIYNLDSAIISEEEEDDDKVVDVLNIALEGIERGRARVNSIEKDLQEIESLVHEKLKEAVEQLNQALMKLTDNENITALRLQLAKARAVESTKEYKRNLIKNARQFIPLLYRFFKGKFKQFSELISNQLKQFGLIEDKIELTAELSDFLLASDAAVEKLPFVYRRLYRIEPLKEDIFFEGRLDELNQLKKAYENWESKVFSNCSIVGEKGSGASSLLNFFLKDFPEKDVIRYKLNEAHSSKQDFIDLFQKILDNPKISSIEDLETELKSGKKKIIVLEDTQHLFLKKPGGFEALNSLFELMSETAKDVFWVIEVTIYTWQYLQNTINIQRYFKHNIQLSSFTDEQIVKLIMKRHRVSGYDLEFEAINPNKVEQRKLKKMQYDEKQSYLKERFFKKLNLFAKSNISLALMYWIRSTQRVEENTIVIGELPNSQFEFLQNLHNQYIFTLHSLLTHDSLDIEEHAQLFHQSESQSKMILMVLEDNGVLKCKDDRFHINRLLYRQTVNVLRNKNILH